MAIQNHLQVAKLSKPTSNKHEIYGLNLDDDGRCQHYHSQQDVVALACSQCQQFFACYLCHDVLKDHSFVPVDKACNAILCGHCRHTMNFQAYSQNSCPICHYDFNPKCKLHYAIYFK
jgi:biotin transport system substrate-specific component